MIPNSKLPSSEGPYYGFPKQTCYTTPPTLPFHMTSFALIGLNTWEPWGWCWGNGEGTQNPTLDGGNLAPLSIPKEVELALFVLI